jgi:hypothetical protein
MGDVGAPYVPPSIFVVAKGQSCTMKKKMVVKKRKQKNEDTPGDGGGALAVTMAAVTVLTPP